MDKADGLAVLAVLLEVGGRIFFFCYSEYAFNYEVIRGL